ncbi:molybdopterin-guanine dinucleotide biosynthesis adapter protein [bacterium BMS3Bbin10]|nr:molybdopterin-guanine dinucleotide biosynthesis adapter protein [bacterium BMS3Bbin10]HDL16215.1 molybdopterin-guanine dinucleotide biosynthesis protein B [Hyphomicrobiales bacterium]
MTHKIFGVIGWKNSGKTTLMARLLEEFSRRGYVVSAIKHAHHKFDIDHPGRDSYKFRNAGARQVALISPKRWALMHEFRDEEEPDFEEILSHIGPCDLILVEGYKGGPFPKIEARSPRSLTQEPLSGDDRRIVAIASDGEANTGALPGFDVNDIGAIADFIAGHLGLVKK